jgi:hypothetical protein
MANESTSVKPSKPPPQLIIADMSKFTIFASISGALVSAYTLYILFTRSNTQTTQHPHAPQGHHHR